MKGKRKINKIIIDRKREKLPLLMTKAFTSNLKPLEEWIYGKLNKKGNNGTITFKNQTAFNGYEGNKLDLCKIFLILYKIIKL